MDSKPITLPQLLSIQDKIYEATENNEYFVVCLLLFDKGFRYGPHEILIRSLEYLIKILHEFNWSCLLVVSIITHKIMVYDNVT